MKPYLRVANVFEDRIDTSDVKTMNFEPAEFERFRLMPGDVLLNEGQSPEYLGRPAIYRGNPAQVAFTNSLIRFRPNATVTSEWALAVFRHHMHSGRFARESRITTNIAHLSKGRLANVEFPVPPRAEQERIVTALEEAFSKLDAGNFGLQKARGFLNRMRESVLAAGVTGQLVSHSDADTSASQILADMGVDPIDDESLPPLPEGWAYASLGRIADVVGGITKDAKRQDDPAFVQVPYLRVANVQRGYLDLSKVSDIRVPKTKALQLELRYGDILFNEGGDRDKLGRGWVWENQIPACIHQNHVFRARMRDSRLHPRLISFWGNSFGKQWFELRGRQTTNLASLNLTTLKSFPVPIGPPEAQSRNLDELERQFSFIEASERAIDASLARSAGLRRSVLKAAFDGTLVPQDPTDEPASVLVQRIRADREQRLPPDPRGRRSAAIEMS